MELQRNYIGAFGLCGYTAHYQPIISANADDYTVVGYEALCRRHHSGVIQRGDEIVRQAKADNVLSDLDRFMIMLNVSVGRLLSAENFISVNVSAQSLVDTRFVEQLFLLGVTEGNLIIEITESEKLAKNKFHTLKDNAVQLRNIGWKFAIDDFGDGHSSIRYLNMIDVDIVKISRDFMFDLKSASDAKRNFMSDLVMCFSRQKILTVMEGIETKDDLAIAKELKIDFLQGYMFGKPTAENEPGREAAKLTPFAIKKHL